MKRLRVVIQGKERWLGLDSYILLIDQNKENNPNIALDSAKSILESVSKTILKDKGITYNEDSKLRFLVKRAFGTLPVFLKLSNVDAERGKSIINSLENISEKIGEFRNDYGFFSHGQDLEAEKFDRYLVDLAIHSSDLLASFLITSHSEDFKNRQRLFYEENPEFNKWFDKQEERVEVKGVPYSPSKTLFSNDLEAYKDTVIAFENDPDALIGALEDANDQDIIVDNIIKLKPIFSEDNLKALAEFAATQNKINEKIRNRLTQSGLLDAIENIQKIIKPQIDAATKIQEVTQNIVKARPMFPRKKK